MSTRTPSIAWLALPTTPGPSTFAPSILAFSCPLTPSLLAPAASSLPSHHKNGDVWGLKMLQAVMSLLPLTLLPKASTYSRLITSYCQPPRPVRYLKITWPYKHFSRGGPLFPKPFSFCPCLLSLPTAPCCLVMGEMGKQTPPTVAL